MERQYTFALHSVYKMEREEDVPLDNEQKHYNAPVGDFGFLGEDNPPDELGSGWSVLLWTGNWPTLPQYYRTAQL